MRCLKYATFGFEDLSLSDISIITFKLDSILYETSCLYLATKCLNSVLKKRFINFEKDSLL